LVMATKRRCVTLGFWSRKERRGRLWAFGYEDLSQLLGLSRSRLRHLVQKKEIDPSNLKLLFEFWQKRCAIKDGLESTKDNL